jgi:hypothetical protein
MRTSKVVLLVAGALTALLALGLVVAGGGLAFAQAVARDDDGVYRTPTERFRTDGAALTTSTMDLTTPALDREDGRFGRWDLDVTARVRARSTSERPLFVGIARSDDVARFLDGVAYDAVRDVGFDPFVARYDHHAGSATAPRPGDQDIWVASTVGTGRQELRWDVVDGSWTAVVMHADGSPGVTADVSVGARTDLLLPVTFGLLFGGAAVGIIALSMLGAGLAIPGPKGPAPVPQPVSSPAGTPQPAAAYPAHLRARLDEPLSRWLWLVKWLLVLPHLVVLGFLWMAFAVLTFVAGVSILFTGRYPRSIFDFNVGVLRWSWRVTYYAFVLGTDRYPPFSLSADPRYPCDFDVDYPERLSQGLVLVKWWLLAIPHFLVLAVFGAGLGRFAWDGQLWDRRGTYGFGLVGLLVLVSAVVLAFRGRYPRSVFDFVMGMLRWTYRVYAYVALLRDEYPPFRLDVGGDDPGSGPPAVPPPAPPARDQELVSA